MIALEPLLTLARRIHLPLKSIDQLNLLGTAPLTQDIFTGSVQVVESRWPKLNPTTMHPRKTVEQIESLTRHIDNGIGHIQEGLFHEAIAHFCNDTAAEQSGLKLNVNWHKLPQDLLLKSALKIFGNSRYVDEAAVYEGMREAVLKGTGKSQVDSGFLEKSLTQWVSLGAPGKITLELCQLPQKTLSAEKYREIEQAMAYVCLEEWYHAAQDALGIPLSRKVKQLTQTLNLPETRLSAQVFVKKPSWPRQQLLNLIKCLEEPKLGSQKKSVYYSQLQKWSTCSAKEVTNKLGRTFSSKIWGEIVEATFGKKLSAEAYRYAQKMSFNELFSEMDFAQFCKEQHIPIVPHMLTFHNRGFLINS